jgi:hypothetical protein
MKDQSVIYMDAAGYPRRAARIKTVCEKLGIPFLHATPADVGIAGALPLSLPLSWLPQKAATAENIGFYEWFRMHLHLCVAADHLPKSKYVWMIEADVDGTDFAFERLFTQTLDQPEEGLWPRLFYRNEVPDHPMLEPLPEWYQVTTHNCVMRASIEAREIWIATAEETREVHTESASASVLHRAGLSIGKINHPYKPSLYHTGTLRFNPGRSAIEPCQSSTMLRHPIKRDDTPKKS